MSSLLLDCQNCFEKGHESWKSYFSKWENLAKHEGDLSESELNEWNDDVLHKINRKKRKKQLLKRRNLSTISLPGNKKRHKDRKNYKKVIRKVESSQKNKQNVGTQAIEQSKDMDTENILEKKENEQLEMNLRAIFMNILKANKNKWEIFSVLSQTFSHGDPTVKGSHPPFQNQHLALTSNDVKLDDITFSFKNQDVFSLVIPRVNFTDGTVFQQCGGRESFWPNKSLQLLRSNAGAHLSVYRNQCTSDNVYSLKCWPNDNFIRQNMTACHSYKMQTPPSPSSKVGLYVKSGLIKSCPPSYSTFSYQRNHVLRPRALEFGSKFPALEYNKKPSHEYIRKENYDQPRAESVPDASGSREEKSFQSLCSHKRTNGVCLNKENSNFITPERKPSKRKCFSENILERKRRRSSKLFFDNEEEDSGSDDQTENRSPLIRWTDKNQKSLLSPEADVAESDSEESESILDRVKRP